MIPLPGQQDHRRFAAVHNRFAQEFQPVTIAEAVVEKIDIVPVALNSLQGSVISSHPVQIKFPAPDVREQIPSKDIVILVVIDEKNAQRPALHVRLQSFRVAVRRFGTSILPGSS